MMRAAVIAPDVQKRGWRASDLPWLLLIVVLPLVAGHGLGLAFARAPGIVDWRITPVFLLACGVYEAAFLGWLRQRAGAAVPFTKVGRCALRLQLQVGSQMLTRGAVLACCISLADVLMAEVPVSAPSPGWPILPIAWLLAQLALAYLISIAWWRCLSLQRGGVDFSALAAGSLNEKSIVLATSLDLATVALDRHINQLAGPRTPRYSRMFYQANIHVTSAQHPTGAVHALHWTLLPIRVVVTLTGEGMAATRLSVQCQLRGGIHRLELWPSPSVVVPVMRYLQIHLLDPLCSELALSGAVRKQDALRRQAVEAQLRILQAQIEPHFLFNTLANLRHLYRSSTDDGEAMLDHLIAYLRSTLEELRADTSTVDKEMDLALHYLAIMKIRMGERLSYSFIQPGDVATLAFPPAMLISLVENAIMHGLSGMANGRLTISAARDDGRLVLTVLDNGAGFSSVQGSGVGLSNIRQRLEAMHGNHAWLEVGALAGSGFMARIVIPILETP